MTKRYPTVLSIAGSDCSGGAGIQADIKTISANGAYAATVLTTLTAQNTLGVQSIELLSPVFVAAQLDSIFTDLRIDAVKIGLLPNIDIMHCIMQSMQKYQPRPIIIDPVMIAKGGTRLVDSSAMYAFKKNILSIAALITPNIEEAEYLSDTKIVTQQDMITTAVYLAKQHSTHVLLKGGHFSGEHCSDLLYLWPTHDMHWFPSPRIHTHNTHGTGCSLSSAIATYLAKGVPLVSAITHAKQYVTAAIQAGSQYSLGQGHGPIHHFYSFW